MNIYAFNIFLLSPTPKILEASPSSVMELRYILEQLYILIPII